MEGCQLLHHGGHRARVVEGGAPHLDDERPSPEERE
jgi:hypothetical protein